MYLKIALKICNNQCNIVKLFNSISFFDVANHKAIRQSTSFDLRSKNASWPWSSLLILSMVKLNSNKRYNKHKVGKQFDFKRQIAAFRSFLLMSSMVKQKEMCTQEWIFDYNETMPISAPHYNIMHWYACKKRGALYCILDACSEEKSGHRPHG